MENLTPEEAKRFQQILAEINDYQAAADIIRQQIEVLTASFSELMMTSETIKTLEKLKPETEILVPIGSNSYLTAKIVHTDRVIIGLGAEISAQKRSAEAIQMLEDRMTEVGNAIEQMRQELEKIDAKIDSLRPEAEKLLEKSRETKP
jgi:prefoldin alpha subunit